MWKIQPAQKRNLSLVLGRVSVSVTFHSPKCVTDVFVNVNVVYVLCLCVHKGSKFNLFVCTGIALSCERMVYS